MSNIIQFKPLSPKATPMQRIQSVLELVAQSRRRTEDVFWLKENAEALNVLESSGQDVTSDALSVYDEFYDTIEQKLQFFPQYYRFSCRSLWIWNPWALRVDLQAARRLI